MTLIETTEEENLKTLSMNLELFFNFYMTNFSRKFIEERPWDIFPVPIN